jgi:hypothetical protein
MAVSETPKPLCILWIQGPRQHSADDLEVQTATQDLRALAREEDAFEAEAKSASNLSRFTV